MGTGWDVINLETREQLLDRGGRQESADHLIQPWRLNPASLQHPSTLIVEWLVATGRWKYKDVFARADSGWLLPLVEFFDGAGRYDSCPSTAVGPSPEAIDSSFEWPDISAAVWAEMRGRPMPRLEKVSLRRTTLECDIRVLNDRSTTLARLATRRPPGWLRSYEWDFDVCEIEGVLPRTFIEFERLVGDLCDSPGSHEFLIELELDRAQKSDPGAGNVLAGTVRRGVPAALELECSAAGWDIAVRDGPNRIIARQSGVGPVERLALNAASIGGELLDFLEFHARGSLPALVAAFREIEPPRWDWSPLRSR